MRSNRFFRIALVALGVSVAVLVTRANQTYTVYGSGTLSCGNWLSQKAESRVVGFGNLSWVLGFVSGVAASGRKLTETDLKGIELWMDQYCAKNPLQSVANASSQLIVALDVK